MGLICRQLVYGGNCGPAGDEPLLDGLNADFEGGTVSVVTGATGAGKTTLMHLLGCLLRPDAGQIEAGGQPVSRWPAAHQDRWRRQVGIVFQHGRLMPNLSVAENIALPLVPRKMTWARVKKMVADVMAALELTRLAAQPVRLLSGGQQQRVAVARALAPQPAFVLADEPTAFQDDAGARRIIHLLTDAAKLGATVVACSHDPRLTGDAGIHRCVRLTGGRLGAMA